jgi:hypothetical protein
MIWKIREKIYLICIVNTDTSLPLPSSSTISASNISGNRSTTNSYSSNQSSGGVGAGQQNYLETIEECLGIIEQGQSVLFTLYSATC